MRTAVALLVSACCAAAVVHGQQPAAPPASGTQAQAPTASAPAAPAAPTADANGNPLRHAKTGHVSNYDEVKVPPYVLPDPLVMASGTRVTTAAAWRTERRPEILRFYETDIFGRIPAKTPNVVWAVKTTDPAARSGAALMKQVVGTVGSGPGALTINVTLYTPAKASGPVPVILLANFGGGGTPIRAGGGASIGDPPVAAEILARGWGYAMVGYQDIQPDRANALDQGIIGLTSGAMQTPGPGQWGSIGAWAWGVSRVIDYLATDKAVDAGQIALQGHSRLGKSALWASALDDRIKVVYASCSGEMGAALSRRDWGESVDDMTQNFPWWFAEDFQKYAGHWNTLPVDAHMLIALSAPRPVFITGGTTDQWADPVGMFLAEVAAGPVYRLLGKSDLGISQVPPPLDTPVIKGDLGWHYHTGGHAATPEDWKAFLSFAGKYLK
ncbi:MAG: acetylxylan esterase [Acidobacteriota bacterium]